MVVFAGESCLGGGSGSLAGNLCKLHPLLLLLQLQLPPLLQIVRFREALPECNQVRTIATSSMGPRRRSQLVDTWRKEQLCSTANVNNSFCSSFSSA